MKGPPVMSSLIFHTNPYRFRKKDKTCNLWICVDICLLHLEVCVEVLTYLSSCCDETESFLPCFQRWNYMFIVLYRESNKGLGRT